jgi:sporulation protein YlmC with PRC-barrel domain
VGQGSGLRRGHHRRRIHGRSSLKEISMVLRNHFSLHAMKRCEIDPTSQGHAARMRSQVCSSYWPLLAAALLLAPCVPSAQTVHLIEVDVKTVGMGYRVSQLTGKEVINDRGESIGKIDDFIIGRDKVLFSILQVGGFLGLGSKLVAVPYTSLDLERRPDKIVLPGASKESLKNLPEFVYRK